MRLVADADALIKLTKVGAKEAMVKNIVVHITTKIREEVVDEAKKYGYPDALIIEKNLNKKRIGELRVKDAGRENLIAANLGLIGGEGEVLAAYDAKKFDAILSDDGKFLKVLEEFGIRYLTPSAVIVYLYTKKLISKSEAINYLEKLRQMISEEEYHLALDAMR